MTQPILPGPRIIFVRVTNFLYTNPALPITKGLNLKLETPDTLRMASPSSNPDLHMNPTTEFTQAAGMHLT